jgi:hypothetical protein
MSHAHTVAELKTPFTDKSISFGKPDNGGVIVILLQFSCLLPFAQLILTSTNVCSTHHMFIL